MQVTELTNTTRPAKDASKSLPFKPYLKVFKNAIDCNIHFVKLLGLHISDGIAIASATQGNEPPFMVAYPHPSSSAVLAPYQKYMYIVPAACRSVAIESTNVSL